MQTPKEEYEIVIVNDWSDEENTTRLNEWVQTQDWTNKVLWNNWENKGVNYSWNKWVALSEWRAVRIINNDIYMENGLDKKLLDLLNWAKVSCPYTTRWIHTRKLPLFRPDANVAWWCFMLRKSDWLEIPKELFTWYGDNFIFDAYKDNIAWGWRCHHVESQSSDWSYLWPITHKDAEEYKKIRWL